LIGEEQELPLEADFGDAFEVGTDEPNALVIRVGGAYAIEYELTVRYAINVGRLRLALCKNGVASPGAFVERLTSGLPGGEDDPRMARASDVCLHGKAFMLLRKGDKVSLKISAPGIGSVETCDGPNAYLTVQLLRAASPNRPEELSPGAAD
jgi:hypothetical protein